MVGDHRRLSWCDRTIHRGSDAGRGWCAYLWLYGFGCDGRGVRGNVCGSGVG